MATTKDIKDLSYEELIALAETKKQETIDNKKKELTAARGVVAAIEAQLEKLTGKAVVTKVTGRTPKGQTREGVLSFLKNNPGENSPKDIIKATSFNAGSVNQTLAALVKSGNVKKGKGKGAYIFVK